MAVLPEMVSMASKKELMTPDEVRMLDNNLALLFIRGEAPLMDEKYDLLKHPNIKYTTDAVSYTHLDVYKRQASCTARGFDPGAGAYR